jgi:hypothetical protein
MGNKLQQGIRKATTADRNTPRKGLQPSACRTAWDKSKCPGAAASRFLSSDDADVSGTVAALATQLGFAPVELGKLNEGGMAIHRLVGGKPGGRAVSWANRALRPEDCFVLCCRTARAPCTKSLRKQEFPRLLVPSSFCLPPVVCDSAQSGPLHAKAGAFHRG